MKYAVKITDEAEDDLSRLSSRDRERVYKKLIEWGEKGTGKVERLSGKFKGCVN